MTFLIVILAPSKFVNFNEKVKFWILLKILWKMEHLLQKSKCCIFHNIFKYIYFKGLKRHYSFFLYILPDPLSSIIGRCT